MRVGLECEAEADRDAYGMLTTDFAYILDAFAHVVASGEALRVEYQNFHDPHERACLIRLLARSCATQSADGTRPAVYHDLARHIVTLMDETKEAA